MTGLPGDYNQNGVVDAADYVVWRDNEGTTNMLPNDSIGGEIGAAHYNQWRAYFGQSAASGAALGRPSREVVPEPRCLFLVCLGVGGLLAIRALLLAPSTPSGFSILLDVGPCQESLCYPRTVVEF